MDNNKFLDINGVKIKYAEYGQGFPVVFVHAGIADSRMWDEQIEPFSQHYRVITYDLRGYGQSSPAAGTYSHHEDLFALLDHLAVKRFALVGCSIGGGVVMDAALAAPDRVAAVVVVAGMANGLDLDIDFEEPQQVEALEAAFKANDLETVNELEVQIFVDGFNQPAGRADAAVREKVREMNAIALKNEAGSPDAKRKVLEPYAGTRLGEFQMPLLFITGGLDEPVVRQVVEYMLPQISQAQHVGIEGSAHLPSMQTPGEFNQIVLDFLRGASNLD